MYDHSSDGSHVCASNERLAAFAKLSPDQVHRLIYGYTDKRTGKHKGLLERGILTCLVKAKRKKGTWKMTPAVFRINEYALELDPKVTAYLDADAARAAQGQLPIIPRYKAGVPPAAISDESHAHAARCSMGNQSKPHGATEHPRTVQPSTPHGAVDQAAPCGAHSKALGDSKANDPKEGGIQILAPTLAPPEAVLHFTHRLLELIFWDANDREHVHVVKDALEREIRAGRTPEDAFDFIAERTRIAVHSGAVLNPWFFSESKYRKLTRLEARAQGYRDAIETAKEISRRRKGENIDAVFGREVAAAAPPSPPPQCTKCHGSGLVYVDPDRLIRGLKSCECRTRAP